VEQPVMTFEEFFERNRADLENFARRMDPELAEDAVHEIFTRLMEVNADGRWDESRKRAWCCTCIRNYIKEKWRNANRHAKHRKILAADHVRWIIDPVKAHKMQELLETVGELVDEPGFLTDEERIVVQYRLEGLTYTEIKEKTGWSRAKSCELHSSAIEKLRRELEDKGAL
jgi:RNA polymerase sigma factor (sigma-70 family)